MSDRPYTEDDLRTEAARQYAEVLRSPDWLEVQGEMQGTPIPSTTTGQVVRWHELPGDDYHDAVNAVQELLEDAPDLSRWAVDLGACCLTKTTNLAWGHGDNWALAVQIAHRRGVDDELHTALVDAVRAAVRSILTDRGIDNPELPQQQAEEAVS
ncbi:hypothetical protein ABZX95_17495 [Streptomyces sp. NPDC004232]|uniref:hypothetical protein n=1 Tax=Streptomyces sp. NPDC004232 TaxID=3154454 RepID=UPI0033BB2712